MAAGTSPHVRDHYIPGAPRGGRRTPAIRSGSPEKLDQLTAELTRASNSWDDAAQALSEILANLGLPTAPARTISRAAQTIAAQKHEVSRSRDELLQTDRQPTVEYAKTGNVFRDGWNAYAHHYLPGLGQGAKDMGLSALAGNPMTAPFYIAIKPKGWLERGPVGQIQGLAQGVQHPIAFAKAAINWEEWKRDPVRAFGEAAPTLLITAITMGTGSGSGATARLATALRRTPEAETAKSAKALQEAATEASKTENLTRQPARTPDPFTPRTRTPISSEAPLERPIKNAYRGDSQRRPGGQVGPPISLNKLRSELGRTGLWPLLRDYDIVYVPEIPGPPGAIRYGNSPYSPDGSPKLGPTGKPVIWISDYGLSSLEQAVRTALHESWHQQQLAKRGVPGTEWGAHQYEKKMYREFLRRQRGSRH
ncbi:hypothetical protein [Actinomadura bangladeshensis]|uniref:Tox-MPTase4 domain-containing protein n=1 Tax=Actinomadura bangladeshensis TaxID=453573 RepID=A0A6L9QDA2_9ACTN|nr:hypothetical protein [Actinomadura bangladeshensis]NEA23018.1 hypothetical protein [Actinomadura bangladeshensis]